MIFLMIPKISYYKVGVSTGGVETRWLGGSFLMVDRNNAGRLGAGFISVCLETRLNTRWLGHLGGFYVPEPYCIYIYIHIYIYVHIYVYIYTCIHICVCIYTYIYVCIHVCIRIHRCMYMCAHVCVTSRLRESSNGMLLHSTFANV